MKGKIALEEAVTLPELAYQAAFHAPPGREDELVADLLDIHKQRLDRMDKHGVEYMILSVTSPGAQGFGDKAEAEAFATEANNYLAKEASKNPKRFGAFCVLSPGFTLRSRRYPCMMRNKLLRNYVGL
jgi:2,3-dihydroxybenzoate decarboxylase